MLLRYSTWFGVNTVLLKTIRGTQLFVEFINRRKTILSLFLGVFGYERVKVRLQEVNGKGKGALCPQISIKHR